MTTVNTRYEKALASVTTTDLHDEEMWVIDVESNRTEQILNSGIVGIDPIDEILVPATNYNLEKGIG